MRKLFRQYYPLVDDEWNKIWNDCIFILDANVLLNLYRYSKSTSDDLLSVLKKVENRLWIPHQFAVEYHENLSYVTVGQLNNYRDVDNILESAKENLKDQLDKLKLEERHYSIDPSKLNEKVAKVIEEFQEELTQLKNQQPNHHENLINEIQQLFSNKVGSAPASQDVLDNYYKIAKERYELKRPPGYMDKGKEKDQSKKDVFFYNNMCYRRQYGDFIAWQQIIKQAQNKNLKSVILVTDDLKEDWWRKVGGRQMGPRYELIDEIYTVANVEYFHMYTSARFLEYAKQKFNLDVKEASIEQIKVVTSRQDYHTIWRTRIEQVKYVLDWLKKKYPTSNFEHYERGRFDIVRDSNSEKVAYIVKFVRSYVTVFRCLNDLVYRGYFEVSQGKFTKVVLIFVIDDAEVSDYELDRIQNQVNRFFNKTENLQLSSSVSIILGTLKEVVNAKDGSLVTRFVQIQGTQLPLFGTEL